MLMERPDVIRVIVGSVLTGLSSLSGLRLEQLASAAVTGMIQAVTENTDLLDTRYTDVIGSLAEGLSRFIADKSFDLSPSLCSA